MSHTTVESKAKNLRELDEVIAQAMNKVGAKGENDIYRFIPMTSGGYIHHFTFRKMKRRQPSELVALIEKSIINNSQPKMVAPKQRAPRGSSKSRGHSTLSRAHLDRLLAIARLAGDKEMISVLSPRRSLAVCKRELIASIRHNQLELELWNSYVDAINAQQENKNS